MGSEEEEGCLVFGLLLFERERKQIFYGVEVLNCQWKSYFFYCL